jgi:lipooligosaccharide transport system permease protein
MRRLEPAAIAGVMSREVANFRTFWKATTFSSVLEPIIYLLAFGLGLGTTIVIASKDSSTSSSWGPGWSPRR